MKTWSIKTLCTSSLDQLSVIYLLDSLRAFGMGVGVDMV